MPTEEQKRKLRNGLLRKKLGEKPIRRFHAWRKRRREEVAQEIEDEQGDLMGALLDLAPESLRAFLQDQQILEILVVHAINICAVLSVVQIRSWGFPTREAFAEALKDLQAAWEGIIEVEIGNGKAPAFRF